MKGSFINSAADAPAQGTTPPHTEMPHCEWFSVSHGERQMNEGTVSEKGPVSVGRAQSEYLDSLLLHFFPVQHFLLQGLCCIRSLPPSEDPPTPSFLLSSRSVSSLEPQSPASLSPATVGSAPTPARLLIPLPASTHLS